MRQMNPTPSADVETLWPRSVQVTAALLVLTTLALLAWHGHLGSTGSTRPSQLLRPERQKPLQAPLHVEETEDDPPTGGISAGRVNAPKSHVNDNRKPMPAVHGGSAAYQASVWPRTLRPLPLANWTIESASEKLNCPRLGCTVAHFSSLSGTTT